MKNLPIPNARATLALVAFILVTNMANGLYAARGIEPSPVYLWLYGFGWIHVIWLWIHDDYRRLGLNEPLDLGYILVIAWPIFYAHHLVRTRGWKNGLLMLGGLFGLFAAGFVFSVVTAIVAQLITVMNNLFPGSGF